MCDAVQSLPKRKPRSNRHGHVASPFRTLLLALISGLTAVAGWAGEVSAWGARQYFTTVYDPEIGPVRLFTEERGEGRPIVLLHGIGGSTYTSRKIAPTLAVGKRVIAIDMKGFGRSSKPGGTRYSAPDQARIVAQFLAANELEGVTLVGHSFGGTVALALLLRSSAAAARVERLVLIDSPAYPQDWPVAADLLTRSGTGELLLTAIPREVTVKLALVSSVKSPSAITAEDVVAYARPLYERNAVHALAETVRDLVATDFAGSARHYGRITQPTLIVWCRSDPLVPLRTAYRLQSALPDATLKIEDNCAHVPLEETPGRLARWLKDFVDP